MNDTALLCTVNMNTFKTELNITLQPHQQVRSNMCPQGVLYILNSQPNFISADAYISYRFFFLQTNTSIVRGLTLSCRNGLIAKNSKRLNLLQFYVESTSCLVFQNIRILQLPICPRYFEHSSCSVVQDIQNPTAGHFFNIFRI